MHTEADRLALATSIGTTPADLSAGGPVEQVMEDGWTRVLLHPSA